VSWGQGYMRAVVTTLPASGGALLNKTVELDQLPTTHHTPHTLTLSLLSQLHTRALSLSLSLSRSLLGYMLSQ
jgi:hypothetical protein